MLPSHALTYFDLLHFAQKKLKFPGDLSEISQDEFNRYCEALRSDESLAALARKYPPMGTPFEARVSRASARHDAAQNANGQRLYDLIDNNQSTHASEFRGSRDATRQWLDELLGPCNHAINDVIQMLLNVVQILGNESQAQLFGMSDDDPVYQQAQAEFQRLLIAAEEKRYNIRQRKRKNIHIPPKSISEIKEALERYLHDLPRQFRGVNPAGLRQLKQVVSWAQLVEGVASIERFQIVIGAIDDGRTAYHETTGQYTCLPGFEEQLLYVMNTVRLSQVVAYVPDNDGERWVSLMIDPMVSMNTERGTSPSDLLYASYFQAAGYQAQKNTVQVWHRTEDFEQQRDGCYELYRPHRWQQIQRWHQELLHKVAEKKELPLQQRTPALILINSLKQKLTDYLQKDNEEFPIEPFELIADAGLREATLRDNFEREIERVSFFQETDLTNEQRSWGLDRLLVRRQEEQYDVIPPQEPLSSEQVWQKLSREFFLSPGHGALVLSLIGQSTQMLVDEKQPSGWFVLQSMAASGAVPRQLKRFLDQGQGIGNLDVSWDRAQAAEYYRTYTNNPDNFIPFLIDRPHLSESMAEFISRNLRENYSFSVFRELASATRFSVQEYEAMALTHACEYWRWLQGNDAPETARAINQSFLLKNAIQQAISLGDNDFLLSLFSSYLFDNTQEAFVLKHQYLDNNASSQEQQCTLLEALIKKEYINQKVIQELLNRQCPAFDAEVLHPVFPSGDFNRILALIGTISHPQACVYGARKLALLIERERPVFSEQQQFELLSRCSHNLGLCTLFEKLMSFSHLDINIFKNPYSSQRTIDICWDKPIEQLAAIEQCWAQALQKMPDEQVNQQDEMGRTLLHDLVSHRRVHTLCKNILTAQQREQHALTESKIQELKIERFKARKNVFLNLISRGYALGVCDYQYRTVMDNLHNDHKLLGTFTPEEIMAMPDFIQALTDSHGFIETCMSHYYPAEWVIKAFQDRPTLMRQQNSCGKEQQFDSRWVGLLDNAMGQFERSISEQDLSLPDNMAYQNHLHLLTFFLQNGAIITAAHRSIIRILKKQNSFDSLSTEQRQHFIKALLLNVNEGKQQLLESLGQSLLSKICAISSWDSADALLKHHGWGCDDPSLVQELLVAQQFDLFQQLWQRCVPAAQIVVLEHPETYQYLATNYRWDDIIMLLQTPKKALSGEIFFASDEKSLKEHHAAIERWDLTNLFHKAVEVERLDVLRSFAQKLPYHVANYGLAGLAQQGKNCLNALESLRLSQPKLHSAVCGMMMRYLCEIQDKEMIQALAHYHNDSINASSACPSALNWPQLSQLARYSSPLYDALAKSRNDLAIFLEEQGADPYSTRCQNDLQEEQRESLPLLCRLLSRAYDKPALYWMGRWDISLNMSPVCAIDFLIRQDPEPLNADQLTLLQKMLKYYQLSNVTRKVDLLQSLLLTDRAEGTFCGDLAAQMLDNRLVPSEPLLEAVLSADHAHELMMQRLINAGFMKMPARILPYGTRPVLGAILMRKACAQENWGLVNTLHRDNNTYINLPTDSDDNNCSSPLEDAIALNSINKVRRLLDLGAQVNRQSIISSNPEVFGWTPLMLAISLKFYPIARLLISHGAHGRHIAFSGHFSVIDYLIEDDEPLTQEKVQILELLEGRYNFQYVKLKQRFFEKLMRYDSSEESFTFRKAQQMLQEDQIALGELSSEIAMLFIDNLDMLSHLVKKRFSGALSEEARLRIQQNVINGSVDSAFKFIRILAQYQSLKRYLPMEPINTCLIDWLMRMGSERAADVVTRLLDLSGNSGLRYFGPDRGSISNIQRKITHCARAGDFLMAQSLMSIKGCYSGWLFGTYVDYPPVSWLARWSLYLSYRRLTIEQVHADPAKALSLLTIGVQLGFEGSSAAELKREAIFTAIEQQRGDEEIAQLLQRELCADKVKQASWWVKVLRFFGCYNPSAPATYLNVLDERTGESALTQAVILDNVHAVRALCDAGASITMANARGQNALDLAFAGEPMPKMLAVIKKLGYTPAPSAQSSEQESYYPGPGPRVLFSLGQRQDCSGTVRNAQSPER